MALSVDRLCDPIEELVDNPLDVSNLFENLASNFAGVVQYNKDNSPHATITIDQVNFSNISMNFCGESSINMEILAPNQRSAIS